MKKIFLSVAMLSVAFVFAQKKEISAAVKAIDAKDMSTANTQLAAAEAAMGNKTYLLEPSVLEQYYYVKGLSLLKSGKTAEGATYLAKISELGKSKIYSGKDSSKNKVYYVGEEAMKASGVEGLKQESYTPTLVAKLGAEISPISEASSKVATDAFNAKNYAVAAPKFREVYDLLKAAGQDNKLFLYYSGLSYAQADKKKEAIEIYNMLIDSGYTGVETTYTAVNKKTKAVENLDKGTWDLAKKMGAASEYETFKNEVTPTKEPEFFETNAALLLDSDRNEEALNLIEKGVKKFPTNAKLQELQGKAYLKTGKMDEFVTNLRAQIAKNPNDAINFYNLGVMLSKDPSKTNESIAAFKKSVELKPDYADAWQNLAYVTMGDDSKSIDDWNAAKKAGKTELANKIINDRRERLAASLPYAEKWYEANPKSLDAVTLLKGLYQSTRNEVKQKEFKAKEEAMKSAMK